MQVTTYEAGGGTSAVLLDESSREAVHIQAQLNDSYAVAWSSELDAAEAVYEFKRLLGNVALGPDTRIHAGGWLEGPVHDLDAAEEFIDNSSDIKAMFLYVGDDKMLHWGWKSFDDHERAGISLSGKQGSLDFNLLDRLLTTTGSPQVIKEKLVIENKIEEFLATHISL